MTTAYTDLLGLALPVQGELDGSWGDTINNAITSLVEDAVAGTTTLSSDADVTLTTTEGDSNQARAAILHWTASGSTTRTITAPAQSKVYVLINGSGTQSIKLVGAGPTTGITAVAGEKCVAAWNGSDFVKVASSVADGVTSVGGTGTVNGLSLSGTVTSTGSITLGGTLSGVNLASAVTGTLPVANGGTGVVTLTGLAKGNGTSAFTAAVSGTDYAPATSGSAILKGNGSGGFSAAVAGTDYAPVTSGTSILSGSGSGGFTNVTIGGGLQFTGGTLSTDGTAGLGTVTSVGVSVPSFLSVSGSPVTSSGTIALSYSGTALPVANGGTGATTLTGLVKGNGTSAYTAAVSGTDYAPATSGTALLKGNGSGGFSAAVSGTDYAPPTSGTSILYGNNSGGFSAVTVGTGLSFSAGTLSATSATGGTVTSVDLSVPAFLSVSGNPITDSGTLAVTLSGTALPVANGGSGATTLTGILKGNGTSAFTAVTAPSGDLVGTTDTQTLTNKTISADDNTISGLAANSLVRTDASGNIDGSATAIAAPSSNVVGVSDTQTLTNKTISVTGNTISGLPATSFAYTNGSGGLDGTGAQKAIPNGTVVGTTDTQTLTNKTLESATLTNGYTEEVYALSGTTAAANPANGSIQTWTLTANSTLTDSLSSGQNIVLGVTPGAYNVTWPTMTWTKVGGGGAAPTLYASGKSWISLWKVGTTLYGSHIGDA